MFHTLLKHRFRPVIEWKNVKRFNLLGFSFRGGGGGGGLFYLNGGGGVGGEHEIFSIKGAFAACVG